MYFDYLIQNSMPKGGGQIVVWEIQMVLIGFNEKLLKTTFKFCHQQQQFLSNCPRKNNNSSSDWELIFATKNYSKYVKKRTRHFSVLKSALSLRI